MVIERAVTVSAKKRFTRGQAAGNIEVHFKEEPSGQIHRKNRNKNAGDL